MSKSFFLETLKLYFITNCTHHLNEQIPLIGSRLILSIGYQKLLISFFGSSNRLPSCWKFPTHLNKLVSSGSLSCMIRIISSFELSSLTIITVMIYIHNHDLVILFFHSRDKFYSLTLFGFPVASVTRGTFIFHFLLVSYPLSPFS